MSRRAAEWLADHPPGMCLRFLESAVKALNTVLLLLGTAVAVWAAITVAQIQAAAAPPPPPQPAPAPLPLHVPWFIWTFGALGVASAAAGGLALLGVRLRSPGCVGGHVAAMCVLLTAQACAALAFFLDAGWETRLPDVDESIKALLAARLQVCKWVGVGLFLLQLLTTLLSCGLQGVYVAVEEAAEDEDEEAAQRRRPLLAAAARRQAAGGSPGGAVTLEGGNDDGWSERMRDRYGLDTSQFSYRPPSRAGGGAGGDGTNAATSATPRGCVVM